MVPLVVSVSPVDAVPVVPVVVVSVVVAVTASAMKGDEQKALAAGCDGYITKPIDTKTTAATIALYLSRGSST